MHWEAEVEREGESLLTSSHSSLSLKGASDEKKKEGEQGKAQGHVAGCPSPFFFEQKAMTIRKRAFSIRGKRGRGKLRTW